MHRLSRFIFFFWGVYPTPWSLGYTEYHYIFWRTPICTRWTRCFHAAQLFAPFMRITEAQAPGEWTNVCVARQRDTFRDFDHVLGGGFNLFYFQPYLGRWSNLTNMFQTGWNHQPDVAVNQLYASWMTTILWQKMSLHYWLINSKHFWLLIDDVHMLQDVNPKVSPHVYGLNM